MNTKDLRWIPLIKPTNTEMYASEILNIIADKLDAIKDEVAREDTAFLVSKIFSDEVEKQDLNEKYKERYN